MCLQLRLRSGLDTSKICMLYVVAAIAVADFKLKLRCEMKAIQFKLYCCVLSLESIVQNDREIKGDANHRIWAEWLNWRRASNV